MRYLLDTNVISELQKSSCNPSVKACIGAIPADELFTSVIVIGEIAYGVNRLPPSKKKQELAEWLNNQLPRWFDGRILEVDMNTMLEWGSLFAGIGKTFPVIDSIIAATAVANGLTLVTRNTRDFAGVGGLSLLNPWD